MITVGIGSVLAPLLFACSTAPPIDQPIPPADWCPGYTLLHGSTDPCGQLNVVLLSAGFTEDELPTYRCAAGLLVDRLLAAPPYSTYAGGINVFRIDVASPSSGVPVASGCALVTCKEQPLAPSWPMQNSDCGATESSLTPAVVPYVWRADTSIGQSCVSADLDLKLCGQDPNVCRLIWPGHPEIATEIAQCAPGHDIIVILANSAAHAGGGFDNPAIVVATLEGIGDPANRSNLLAHEFGHAAGLLDEYPNGGVMLEYEAGRNVAWENDPGFPASVPWTCTASCGGSAEGCGRPASPSCLVIANQNCDPCANETCCEQPQVQADCVAPNNEIGLWEGAVGHCTGYFRSQADCRMGSDIGQPFCSTCLSYVDRDWKHLGHCRIPTLTGLPVDFPELWGCEGPGCPDAFTIRTTLGDPAARPIAPDAAGLAPFVNGEIAAFRAIVTLNGIQGELDIDALQVAIIDPADGGSAHTVSIRRTAGDRYERLEWSVDGAPVPTGPAGESARRLLARGRTSTARGSVTATFGTRNVIPSSFLMRVVRSADGVPPAQPNPP